MDKSDIDGMEAKVAIRRLQSNRKFNSDLLKEAMLDEKDRIARLEHPTEADISWVHENFGFASGGIIKRPMDKCDKHDFRIDPSSMGLPRGDTPIDPWEGDDRTKATRAAWGNVFPRIIIDPKEKFISAKPGHDPDPSYEALQPCDPPLTKNPNPKDAVGTRKGGTSAVSAPVIAELGLAMLEGARKYGRHNWRVAPVRLSIYYDAAIRHLAQWWEGEDIDPDSKLSHIVKAMACLMIIRDALLSGMAIDDRPPQTIDPDWMVEINRMAGEIIDMYPDAKPPFVKGDEQ